MAQLFKTGAKLVVGVGAVYVTLDQGVWSGSNAQGSNVLNNVRKSILPETTEYLEKVPTAKCLNSAAINTWNRDLPDVYRGGLCKNVPSLFAMVAQNSEAELKIPRPDTQFFVLEKYKEPLLADGVQKTFSLLAYAPEYLCKNTKKAAIDVKNTLSLKFN